MKKPLPLTWTTAMELFETHLRARRTADRTIEEYVADLENLSERMSGTVPGAVTLELLRDFQVSLFSGAGSRSRKPLGASSVARTTAVLRSFFGFLFDEERIDSDPTARLESPKLPRRAPGGVLTVREVRRLLGAPCLATPHGLRDRAILELLYSTGLRRAELLGLDLGDVDHGQRELTVQDGKGHKGRVVPITRSAYKHLAAYLERGRPVLAAKHPGASQAVFLSERATRLGETRLKDLVEAIVRWVGISKKVTPHTFRRSFATHLLQGGASLRHIQILLGHARLDTTAVYLRLNAEELRREILLRHPREKIDA